jgi:PPOX class probable F420-dependent enzyme
MTGDVTTLAARKFVSVTTFKKNGEAVAAPVWIGRDGDDLFVWTPADSWKVKRVRNDSRVTLVPCSRFGRPDDGAPPVDGTAQVVTDAATVDRLTEVIRRKYGLEFHLVTFIERLAARGRRTPRVILRIALAR